MYKKLDDITCLEIIKEYKLGIKKSVLSRKYNVSYSSISNIIERNGRHRIIPGKKYIVDESFFDIIDTKEKAYWLGFLYADGFVIKKDENSIYTGLGLKDIDHVEKFKKEIKSTHKIKSNKSNNFFTIHINSKKFSKNLIKNGCVPRKTNIINFPMLRDDLLHHFIRGNFDGDGCITNTARTISFNLCCANYQFLNSIRQEIKKKNDIKSNLSIHTRRDGLNSFIVSSINDICKLYHYLYKDATYDISLSRKRLIFEDIIENKDEYIKKRKLIDNERSKIRRRKNSQATNQL